MEFVNLTDLCKDYFWIMPQTPKYMEDGEIPYITSKNIKSGMIKFDKCNKISYDDFIKISKNREIIENDFLISMIGTLGEVAIVKNNDLPFYGQNMFLLRLNEELVDLKFIYYFLISNDTKIKLLGRQNKATQSYLRYNDVVSLQVPNYDKNTQIEIAKELSNIIELIEKNNKILLNLENIVKSQFIEMFEGKYNTIKIGDEFKTTSGGTPLKNKKEYYENGTIPWLTSGEVNSGIIYDANNYITELGMNKSSAKLIPVDSVLVAMYGATAGVVGLLKKELTTNQAVCSILPNKDFYPEYLYYSLIYKSDELKSRATGGAQPNISQAIIRDTEIYNAPKESQSGFVTFVQQIDKSKYIKSNLYI